MLPDFDVECYQVAAACHAVTENRSFNLVTRNSQHWVCEVIELLQARLNTAKKIDVSRLIKTSGVISIREEGSPHEEYAANLGGSALGVAVYIPVPFRDGSGRVGDIAFFDEKGVYQWLGNAFSDKVTIQQIIKLLLTSI